MKPRPWDPKPIPQLSCAVHHHHITVGWETTAYLGHVAQSWNSIARDALYLFLQGAGPGEFRGPLAGFNMSGAVQRVLESNATFASLSGLLSTSSDRKDNGQGVKFCQTAVALKALRLARGGNGWLGCEGGYLRPLRGQFAVAGWKLHHALNESLWQQLFEQQVASDTATTSRIFESYENAWSTLFGCVHQVACPYKPDGFKWGSHSFTFGAFDCVGGEGAPDLFRRHWS